MIEPSGSAVRRGQECAHAAGAANGSHVRNGFPRNGVVGTRSRLIRVSMSDGHIRCTASDGGCTLARPASPVKAKTWRGAACSAWRRRRLWRPRATPLHPVAGITGPCAAIARYRLEAYATLVAVPVWNASVDGPRRPRQSASTIGGGTPDMTIGRPAAVHAGARPYHRIGIA
jgi:hypothetical protein